MIRTLHVYAQYCLVNRTGLYMEFHDAKNEHIIGRHHPVQVKLTGEPREWYTRDSQRSVPLLYGSTHDDPKLLCRIAESHWSKARSVSSLAPTAELEMLDGKPTNGSTRQFVLSVTVEPCKGLVRFNASLSLSH